MFYRLSDPLSNVAFRGDTERESYSFMRSAVRGEQTCQKEVIIRHDSGRVLLDFIWVSLIPIIHERIVNLLQGWHIRGWSTYPVEVLDLKGNLISGYHGLSIVGRCQSMFLDKQHSQLVYDQTPTVQVPVYRGLHLTLDSWDETDIFTSTDGRTNYYIVTDKVRALFVREKVKNVKFTPVSDVEVIAMDQPSVPRSGDASVIQ